VWLPLRQRLYKLPSVGLRLQAAISIGAGAGCGIIYELTLQNVEQLFCLRHITILEPWQGWSDGRSFPGQEVVPYNDIVLIEFPSLRSWVAKLLLSARKRTVSITWSFPYNHAREHLLRTPVWAAHAAACLRVAASWTGYGGQQLEMIPVYRKRLKTQKVSSYI
jgi:hypothetical protein